MGKKKDSVSSLGRNLIKERKKNLSKHLYKTNRHVLDLEESKNTISVTETTTLEEFLTSAQMANVEFTAEREDIQIVDPNHRSVDIKVSDNKEALLIPRRPQWDESTTPEELNQLEYDLYLEWRRHLSHIQENEDIVMTPFEKNIEFWRQLWRVVERSDVCVQILDARNPLLFLSEDLQKYVKEVNESKVNVILMNKSDFLTPTQRHVWAKHFDSMAMRALFFSAKQQLECDDDNDLAVDEESDSTHNSSKLLSRQQLINLFKSMKSENSSDPITIEFEDQNRFATPEELLTTYGFSRGFMTQRGIPDNCRSARYILKDFVCGKLLYCYCPPNGDQKSFHEFPQNSNQTNIPMSEALKRILESSHITQKDFNNSYFHTNYGTVHTKGVVSVSGYSQRQGTGMSEADTTSSTCITSKPWKKHNNRNKKEKLRRVYAHLDQ
ncbi:unnamed protein product [Oppiella nova]|uniref:Large subunit GTPase 1 homolog n=1 Tax=Oppiella nova TaxID=334625 RepID=A0A7R9M827_9ACAR|nr:unnamed protein product [Oppiella nova]CAG2172506.1 unnamed protein product [Oppiella nova]